MRSLFCFYAGHGEPVLDSEFPSLAVIFNFDRERESIPTTQRGAINCDNAPRNHAVNAAQAIREIERANHAFAQRQCGLWQTVEPHHRARPSQDADDEKTKCVVSVQQRGGTARTDDGVVDAGTNPSS